MRRKKKTFLLKSNCLKSFVACNAILESIPKEDLPKNLKEVPEYTELIHLAKHTDPLVSFIAQYIHNKPSRPSKKLISFLRNNLTLREVFEAVAIIGSLGDYGFFLNSLALASSMGVQGDQKMQNGSTHGS